MADPRRKNIALRTQRPTFSEEIERFSFMLERLRRVLQSVETVCATDLLALLYGEGPHLRLVHLQFVGAPQICLQVAVC